MDLNGVCAAYVNAAFLVQSQNSIASALYICIYMRMARAPALQCGFLSMAPPAVGLDLHVILTN